MEYAFVFNPVAGRNGFGRQRRIVEAARAAGFDTRLLVTSSPGHATELARSAAEEGYQVIVAVGGDGTVQEVATGIVSSAKRVHMGVIPAGTGNDYARMLKMPGKLDAAFRALKMAVPVQVDYGVVRWSERNTRSEHIFVNAVGIGFDAQVAKEVATFKKLPGIAAYLAAVLRTLNHWKSPAIRIMNGKPPDQERLLYEGRFFLATTGIGVSSGGGFLLTPRAQLSDGYFDVCVVGPISTLRAVQLIPRALLGKHTTAPEVHMHYANALRVTSEISVPVHADGEVLSLLAQDIEIDIVAGGLSVLVAS